jgi:glycosyltransferase involved in cell wall biosynthesis
MTPNAGAITPNVGAMTPKAGAMTPDAGAMTPAGTAVDTVHVVVPDSIDDPARPSGGNTYDRRVCQALPAAGWRVSEHAAPGSWPWPDAVSEAALARELAGIPDGTVVLIDGLIASSVPAVLVPEARRLLLVVLVHLPLGAGVPEPPSAERDVRTRECAVLAAARAIVTTSTWTRERLLELYPLRPEAVHVAEPGVDVAELAAGSADGGALLCVAAVIPPKGHDVLLAALARLVDLPWRCVFVGTLDRDPEFAGQLQRHAEASGIGNRVSFVGPRTADELEHEYAAADVLVLASHAETYGMVVTEALAHGLPVVATAVGGLADALGQAAAGRPPGILVGPDDPQAFATALRSWLTDAELRDRLREAAVQRRSTLSGWSHTTQLIAHVLRQAAA